MWKYKPEAEDLDWLKLGGAFLPGLMEEDGRLSYQMFQEWKNHQETIPDIPRYSRNQPQSAARDGSTLLVHPLTSVQYWIIPERRIIPQFERTSYTLQSPQVHLLAKWQAVKTYDELRNRSARGSFDLPEDPVEESITLYLGRDGESFYLDEATRDIQRVLADNKVCETDASNVRGYSLSEALRRLDKKEDAMVEAKWKPIMAERRKAEEASEEPSYTDGQQTRQQTESSKERANQEECSEASSLVLEESRHAVPEKLAFEWLVLDQYKALVGISFGFGRIINYLMRGEEDAGKEGKALAW